MPPEDIVFLLLIANLKDDIRPSPAFELYILSPTQALSYEPTNGEALQHA